MVTHSSILAWRIPWTEEPAGLQSMGSQELDTTQQLNHHHRKVRRPPEVLLNPPCKISADSHLYAPECPPAPDTPVLILSRMLCPGGIKRKDKGESERKSLCHAQLFLMPWTMQPMEFSRPEYWSGQRIPSPGDLPDPGIEPGSPPLQVDSLPTELSGKPQSTLLNIKKENSCGQ